MRRAHGYTGGRPETEPQLLPFYFYTSVVTMDNARVMTQSRTVGVERELLTPVEAAHVLGMSRAALYRLLDTGSGNGTIRTIKHGRSRRIRRAEVVRYIESLAE